MRSNSQEDYAEIVDVIAKVCCEEDSIEAFEIYQHALKKNSEEKSLIERIGMSSNNYKTTLSILKDSELKFIFDLDTKIMF